MSKQLLEEIVLVSLINSADRRLRWFTGDGKLYNWLFQSLIGVGEAGREAGFNHCCGVPR